MIPNDKVETMLKALREAVADGSITKAQARQFRGEVGITKAQFTKVRPSDDARKAKRKAAKKARKANR